MGADLNSSQTEVVMMVIKLLSYPFLSKTMYQGYFVNGKPEGRGTHIY